MKKGYFLLLCAISLVFASCGCSSNEGEITTAALKEMSVSLFVSGPPFLMITQPYNETYIKNYSMPLDYSMNGDNAWYNIDNGLNVTLTGNTTFNATEGYHTLRVFANDSYGITEKQVDFTVNTTIIKFYYEEYKGIDKGNSTDFLDYTYERLNRTNVTIENARYGKIEWYGAVDFTSAVVIDLDGYTNLSYNQIYFAPENLQPLNKSAKIWIYNLTYSNPVLLRNGVQCPGSICTLISYENGTMIFNVTSFVSSATYSASELFQITWPEGVYEPFASGLAGTHRFSFNITFNNMTAENQSVFQCSIEKSNGNLLILNKTINDDISNAEVYLNYTLSPSDPIDKTIPWKVKNCTLSKNGNLLFMNSDFGKLNGNIYVHNNTWTRFSSVNDDAYRAADCFLGIPKKYFNNSYYCDYAGDVAFSVTMSRGMNLEGECHDNADNDFNGLTDCNDIYCQGIIYSCKNHTWAGDPFNGTCSNGICSETKTAGGKSFTYSYTRYVKTGGLLKFRIVGDSYNTATPVSFAITDLTAFTNYSKYNKTGLALPNEQISLTSYKTEAPSGIIGNIDYVMYVKLNYSEGNYNVSLYIRQYGQDLLIAGIPIVVDNNAPSNENESESNSFTANQCSDGVDNDMDYYQNCADSDCAGRVGGTDCTGGNAYCQLNESTCYDCFDNDADSLTDCADSKCDLMPGNYQNLSNLCEFNGEGYGSVNATYNAIYSWISACSDNFNNDAEDGIDCNDITSCRYKGGTSLTLPCPAYENNSAAWCFDNIDNDYDGIKDCLDAYCKGMEDNGKKCQLNETLDENGNYKAERCFDSLDNDLDGFADCADSDCYGSINPSNANQQCSAQEFNLTEHYQFCTDAFDNNANSLVDCYDLSCKQKFGVCGPCAAIENYTWRSCANGLDDNLNGNTDCSDSNCAGEIGSISSGQTCGTEICNDNFDNDANGKIDCADLACNLQTGPNGEVCQSTESSCNDSLDNDNDGLIDCVDADCFNVGGCNASWSTSSCTTVPYTTSLTQIGSTTVSVSHLSRHYVGTNYTVRIKGTGSYSSVAIILGDATDTGKYFPYNATSCVLSGSNKLRWVSSQSAVGQIQHDPAQVSSSAPLNGFDINLTCASINSNQTKSYPITVANLESGNSESAEASLNAAVYENNPPQISELEVSPLNGKINYGGAIKIRAIPSPDSSGICKCYLNISNAIYESADGNCIITLSDLRNDTNYSFSAQARDGAYNAGDWFEQNYSLDVNPKKLSASTSKNEPFYKGNENTSVSVTFAGAYSDSFSPLCHYTLSNSTNVLLSGNVSNLGSGNSAVCNISVAIPSSDGLYTIQANITDSDGFNVKSDSKGFYVCNNLSSSGNGWTCEKADFDQDSVTEGLYTSLYGASQACDMCIGQVDMNIDKNANGIDSVCDPSEVIVTPPVIPPEKAPAKKADFTVDPSHIAIKVMKDESAKAKLKIKNTGDKSLAMEVDLRQLGRLIKNPVAQLFSFSLESGEEKEIEIEFNTSETGTYPSQIIVKGDGTEKKVTVILTVEEMSAEMLKELAKEEVLKEKLFDAKISMPERLAPLQIFEVSVKLSNVKISGAEATITYQINDYENRVLWINSEPLILEDKSFIKELMMPSLYAGKYVLSVSIRYGKNVVIETKEFTITEMPAPPSALPKTPLAIAIAITIAGIIIWRIISSIKAAKKKNRFFYLYK